MSPSKKAMTAADMATDLATPVAESSRTPSKKKTPATANRVAAKDQDSDAGGTSIDAKTASAKADWHAKVQNGTWNKEIRVVGVSEMKNSQRLLAGYLHWVDVGPLQTFCREDTTARTLMDTFLASKANNFGIASKKEGGVMNFSHEKIMAFIMSDGVDLGTLRDTTWPLSDDVWSRTSRDRGHVSYAIAMYRLLQVPLIASQVGLRPEEQTMPKYFGYTLEDWNRAYELLLQWARQNGPQKSQVDAEKSRKQNSNAAIKPIYITDQEVADGPASAKADAAKAADAIVVDAEQGFEEWDEPGTEPQPPETLDENLEAVSAMISTLSAYTKTTDNQARQLRPLLSDHNVRKLCVEQGRRVRRLWPPPQRPLFPEVDDEPLDPDATALQASADILGEAFSASEDMTEAEMKDFWETQTKLNHVSAQAKPYEQCCEILGLDPTFPAISHGHPVRRTQEEIVQFHVRQALSRKAKAAQPHATDDDVRLFPWQVQGVVFLMEMEDGPIHGAILADDMGLGKTITAIVFLLLQTLARQRLRVDLPASPSPVVSPPVGTPPVTAASYMEKFIARKHRATLLVCPSNAVGVWKGEIAQHFPHITRRYWFGSIFAGRSEDRNLTLGASPKDLYSFLHDLADEPATEHVVVLTTYQTLRSRAMYIELNSSASGADDAADRREQQSEEFDEQRGQGLEDRPPADAEMSEEELVKYQCAISGWFKRGIFDEAHYLKSITTLVSRAVHLLGVESKIFLTGTPMINRPIDLLGLLQQIWRDEWQPDSRATLGEYEKATDSLSVSDGALLLTQVNIRPFLPILDPDAFDALIRGRNGEPTDASTAHTVIPPILRLIQLRRTMAHHVLVGGVLQRIGEQIKPYKIVTVELQMGRSQAAAYYRVHNVIASALAAGRDEDTEENFISMEKHRHLSHVILSPFLAALRDKSNTSKVATWYHRYPDNGVSMLFQENAPKPYMVAAGDRYAMALWMAGESCKMQWLSASSSSSSIGLVRAAHKREDRDTIRQQFNDPDHDVSIMLTSLRVSSSSVNLHHACADVVFVDVPPNASEMFQAIGRVFRLGQTRMGRIVILTEDQTYDGTLQCRAATKMIGNIAAQSNIDVTAEEMAAAKTVSPETEIMDERELRNFVLEQKAAALYTRVTGQRSPRHEWIDSYDVLAKDSLPVEKAFRQKYHLSLAPPPGFQVLKDRVNTIDLRKARFVSVKNQQTAKEEKVAKKRKRSGSQDSPAKKVRSTESEAESKLAHPNPSANPIRPKPIPPKASSRQLRPRGQSSTDPGRN